MKIIKQVRQMYQRVLLSFILVLLSACTQQQETGPGEVRWDRETCTRCNMAIGDGHYAAQVRGAPAGENTKLYKFDDIGCAVVWLQGQGWQQDPRTEIWVADYRNANWLDAHKAYYVKNKLSPMNYGLGAIEPGAAAGAQDTAFAGALNFSQAKSYIMTTENERHQHAGHISAGQNSARQP